MGKIAIWILVAAAVMLLFRLMGPARGRKPRDDAADASRRSEGESRADVEPAGREELIMACAVCGLHIPASEAVYGRGRVYCSAAHRDDDAADRGG